jgi:hypothetical protein
VVDYYLTTPDGSNRFSITDRNTAGGMYNDPLYFTTPPLKPPPVASSTRATTTTSAAWPPARSTPHASRRQLHAAGLIPRPPNGSTPSTPPPNANEGWVDPSSGEHAFTSHGLFTVNVPEPASTGLTLALLAAGVIRRRRHRRATPGSIDSPGVN